MSFKKNVIPVSQSPERRCGGNDKSLDFRTFSESNEEPSLAPLND